jgi:hypothetical protein
MGGRWTLANRGQMRGGMRAIRLLHRYRGRAAGAVRGKRVEGDDAETGGGHEIVGGGRRSNDIGHPVATLCG